jgi:alpha-galactosidase
MFVSEDRNEAVVFYFRTLAEPNPPLRRLALRGLNPDADYRMEGSEVTLAGDRLMNFGIHIPMLHGDFASVVMKLSVQ